MLVVLAIILVVSAIVLSSQSAFNRTLTLANTAYDIGLSIRSAETYGIGSRTASTFSNAGYGVHLASATPGSYVLFADTYPGVTATGSVCNPTPGGDPTRPDAKPGDCAYTVGSGTDAAITTYTLNNGITISDFCAYDSTAPGTWSCEGSASNPLTALDIVFSRPNPTVYLSVAHGGSVATYSQSLTEACIALTASSNANDHRYVAITATGDIDARATSCP